MLLAQPYGGPHPLVGLGGRQPDVDDGDVRAVRGDRREQRVRVGDRGGHLDAAQLEQLPNPAEQRGGRRRCIAVSPRTSHGVSSRKPIPPTTAWKAHAPAKVGPPQALA